MRKYWYIFKAELMSSFQYVFNFFSRIISYLLIMFVFMNLWKYIYSNPDEVINNYTMSQMIWYVTIAELIYSVMNGKKFCNKIINDVRSGNLVYNLNKPYSYINYLLFSHLGEIALNLVISGIVGIAVGFLFLKEFPNLTLFSVLAVVITIVLAEVINILVTIFIGLFAFVIEDSAPFYWIYTKLKLILGTIFPIEFFPKAMQKILNFSPVYANSYGPAKLFVDFSVKQFGLVLIAQMAYIVIGYCMCLAIYKKGVKRLDVNGG